ncbi:hypothetical protein REPUB_Repub03eG0089700 [Reevesia pubescens]
MKSCSSHTWRSISSTKSIVRRGCAKLIGDGTNTSFCYDKWCGESFLTDKCKDVQHLSMGNQNVSEFWDASGWQWDKLRELPKEIMELVSLVYPNQDQRDKVIWIASSNGEFSVSSAYDILLERVSATGLWNLIWKAILPPRIRYFLWLVAHNKLLTKEECFRRRMVTSPTCSRCGLDVESALHVSRDCSFSQGVWKKWLHGYRLDVFNSLSLTEWLQQNLKNHSFQVENSISWSTIFSFTIWFLWR